MEEQEKDQKRPAAEQQQQDSAKKDDAKKARMRQELDTLHQEVELASYATTDQGQRRKKVPRKLSKARSKKRKILEKSDAQERAVQVDDDPAGRLRGSEAALRDEIVQESRMFPVQEQTSSDVERADEDLDDSEEIEEEETSEQEEEEEKEGDGTAAKAPANKSTKRRMYRMKNFKSARMAERHGAAIGAHARGQSLTAVRKLEQVAADAPTAPQVYSSLGMVYESLLSDSRKQKRTGSSAEKSLEEQIELAKKAYGSYHVAAVLCKRDFALWVRAGDTSQELVDLLTEAMQADNLSANDMEKFREEKRKHLEETKKDYTAADNLKPPGIDVPAKLASVHLDLGNLSEALTILTDLKNRGAPSATTQTSLRNEFEKSYKAWLLYADLMLRIGYECTRWNKGIQENSNYMFRRWMRKFSTTFDWQKRRLQALCLALEAAAGSNSCENLIKWAKEHASKPVGDNDHLDPRRWNVDSYEETGAADVTSKTSSAKKKADPNDDDETENVEQVPTLDAARQAVLSKNKLELTVFDAETQRMALHPQSQAALTRALARVALVESHRKALVELIGNFQQHQATFARAMAASTEQGPEPLPIAASCATVCSIASELMKHCLTYGLFQGGRLVGEAVSAYLVERAGLLEKRLQRNASFEQRQRSTAESVLLRFESYDEVGDDESDEDDFDTPYLSDDDFIMENSNQPLVGTLKNGVLPPGLQFMYGLSLIGEGGRDFFARISIKAVEAIPLDDKDAMMKRFIDTDVVEDPSWLAFRYTMTEPLRKTSAFAFAVDILHKVGKEPEWVGQMAPLLQKHLENLQADESNYNALFDDSETSEAITVAREDVVKIVLAFSRIQLSEAESILFLQRQVAYAKASAVLGQLTPLLKKCWKVEPDGSISSECIEGLSIVLRAFNIIMSTGETTANAAQGYITKLWDIVSLVCGPGIPDPFHSQLSDAAAPCKEWKEFPIPADWQNHAQETVSKRIFNLAIGCNVSLFSGWEMDEFNLDLMKRRSANRHFGVNIRGDRVTGYVSPKTEVELANQWKMLAELLPQLQKFDFVDGITKAKSSSWYSKVSKDADKYGDTVAVYGEKQGVSLFLTLSRLCLDTASKASGISADALIKLAVSIILPISEFCLDQCLWNSKIGKAAVSVTAAIQSWGDVALQIGDRRGRARVRPPTLSAPPLKKRSLPKLVEIPVSALLQLWKEGIDETSSAVEVDKEDAKMAMRKVDASIKQLRTCFTEAAIQKSCIHVALSLMDMVVHEYCSNPFLCLQQAAMFASLGTKGGSNDEPFKEGLPVDRECTPLEALVIIGRADCLQALHFPDEAIYLCAYVARVCRLHRDRQETDLMWSSQWKVIGVCAYNLSVAIRTTLYHQSNRSRPEHWERQVVEELKRCREEALVWKRSLEATSTGMTGAVGENEEEWSEDDEFEHRHDDEEEEEDIDDDGFEDHGDDFHALEGDMVQADGTIPMDAMFSNTADVKDDDNQGEVVAV